MGILKILVCTLVIAVNVEARPISYSGGSTLMIKSDNLSNSTYFHYSPSFKYSIGIENTNDKIFKDNKNYIRFTYLLNRKNALSSQRNLYFQSGVDVANKNNHFYGAHGDWETRRWFAGFGYKMFKVKLKIITKINTFSSELLHILAIMEISIHGLLLKQKRAHLQKISQPILFLNFLVEMP